MTTEAPLLIALTGLPSSGKGEAARFILELARARGRRAAHLTFSDQIKEEAHRRGIADGQFTRELLTKMGIEMREAEGPGVLAARIVRAIRSWAEAPDLVVADGLRHPGEIDILHESFGERFILAAIESEPAEIARRLIARRRPDESRSAMQSEEHAIRLLESELLGQSSSLGPNVGRCIAAAPIRIPNHGTLAELRAAVEQHFGKMMGGSRCGGDGRELKTEN